MTPKHVRKISLKRQRTYDASGYTQQRSVIVRTLNPRNCFLIILGTISLFILRLESVVYRELRSSNGRAEEDTVLAKALRHSTTTTNSNQINYRYERAAPVSRNGLITRGLLRTPIDGKMTFDHLDLEIQKIKNQKTEHNNSPKAIRQEIEHSPVTKFSPRIITLNEELEITRIPIEVSPSKQGRTMELADLPMHDDENNNCLLDFERPFYNDCDRVLSQLPEVHSNCNNIHELSLATSETSALLSMKGSWRSVWKIDLDHSLNETLSTHNKNTTNENSQKTLQSASDPVVLKMLHLHRQFDSQSYEAHSKDIIVMDQLTASPYVVGAYGFCGQSVITEFASSTGRDYVKRYDIGSRERMRIARDLARGLADIQALQPLSHDNIINSNISGAAFDDMKNIPVVFSHNDVNIANTVMVHGRIKWNDFNIGMFLRKEKAQTNSRFDPKTERHRRPPSSKGNDSNIKSESPTNHTVSTSKMSSFTPFTEYNKDTSTQLCPAPVIYRSDMWRSPEEIKNISYVQITQSDIYGLGNIFYQVMSRHQPWTFKEPGGALTKTDIANKKINGTIPTIPEQYLNTTKRELQSLFAATNLCFFPDPKKRPTARRLAFGLGTLYNKLKHKDKFTRKVILDYLVP